ncbi:uncharacterized protein V6R79_018815 [Siganus canaliculatus]
MLMSVGSTMNQKRIFSSFCPHSSQKVPPRLQPLSAQLRRWLSGLTWTQRTEAVHCGMLEDQQMRVLNTIPQENSGVKRNVRRNIYEIVFIVLQQTTNTTSLCN